MSQSQPSSEQRFQLRHVAFFGRTLAEYLRMLALEQDGLQGLRILDVASGPGSFVAEALAIGLDVTGCDPMYGGDPEAISGNRFCRLARAERLRRRVQRRGPCLQPGSRRQTLTPGLSHRLVPANAAHEGFLQRLDCSRADNMICPDPPEAPMTNPLTNASHFHLGFILAVLASVLWGLTYCLDERVLSSLSVFKLYFLHCLCGVLVAGVILLVQGNSPAGLFSIDTAKASLPLIGLTLITATAAALSILGSIQLLGANKSAVLEISYPLFVALFSVLLFKGQLQLPVVIGGIFIFIGSAIIVLGK